MPKISGLYNGLKVVAQNADNPAGMDTIIDLWNTINADLIVGLTMFPRLLCSSSDGYHVDNAEIVPFYVSVDRPSNIQGYEPKNNKLFTHPYVFLSVDCISNQKCYKWEVSQRNGGETIAFELCGVISNDPCVVCTPLNYNYFGAGSKNPTEQLVLKGFGQLPYSSNTLIQLFGSNGLINRLGNVGASMALAYVNPNLAIAGMNRTQQKSKVDYSGTGSGSGLIDYTQIDRYKSESTTVNETQDLLAKYRQENEIGMRGAEETLSAVTSLMNMKTDRGGDINANIANYTLDFYFITIGIKREYAEKIDKFFDMYGYATNTVKVPNRYVRPKWCYVKTRECNLKPAGRGLPASVMAQIAKIYNSGIRFWKVSGGSVDVGNYNQDNRV